MVTEKAIIKCEAVFSDDHMHRFLWKHVWDQTKLVTIVIMLNLWKSNGIVTDIGEYAQKKSTRIASAFLIIIIFS